MSAATLYTDVLLGVGYLHTFRSRKLFAVKNGAFEPVADGGKPSFMLPLSVALGYHFKSSKRLSFSPFVSYRWFLQAFLGDSDAGMTHLLLTVGTKIYFGGK
ncbi:MAG: hypothetical protein ACE5HS_22610 [bacterium]